MSHTTLTYIQPSEIPKLGIPSLLNSKTYLEEALKLFEAALGYLKDTEQGKARPISGICALFYRLTVSGKVDIPTAILIPTLDWLTLSLKESELKYTFPYFFPAYKIKPRIILCEHYITLITERLAEITQQ
jgi:hypothetical protein